MRRPPSVVGGFGRLITRNSRRYPIYRIPRVGGYYIAKVLRGGDLLVDSFVTQMRSPSTHLRAFLKVSRMLFINELHSFVEIVMHAESDNIFPLATHARHSG